MTSAAVSSFECCERQWSMFHTSDRSFINFVVDHLLLSVYILMCDVVGVVCRFLSLPIFVGIAGAPPGPFRPRISPWVRGHECRQGETGALPPRGRALVNSTTTCSTWLALCAGLSRHKTCAGRVVNFNFAHRPRPNLTLTLTPTLSGAVTRLHRVFR